MSRDQSKSTRQADRRSSRPRTQEGKERKGRRERRRARKEDRGKRTHQKQYPKTQPHPSNPYVHPVVSRERKRISYYKNTSIQSLIHSIPLLFRLSDVGLVSLGLYRMFLGLRGGELRIGMIHYISALLLFGFLLFLVLLLFHSLAYFARFLILLMPA
jgi:hypothetical protein